MYASPQQAALYSRLDVPHYLESAALMKKQIALFMDTYPGLNCFAKQHFPFQNSIHDFLIVLNDLPSDFLLLFQAIDWDAIARAPYLEKTKAPSSSGPTRLW